MSSEPTPLQRKIEYIRANARYHEGGRNAGATHDHGECLLLDAYEAANEAARQALRERQDALDQKRWAEAEDFAAYRADLEAKVRALLGEYERNGAQSQIDENEYPAHRSGAPQRWAARVQAVEKVLRLLTDGAEPPADESVKRIIVPCREPFLRHRWEWVRGTMATPDHEYIERRCSRCGEYESEVR